MPQSTSTEIALICGDQKVGHRSDTALIGELSQVLDLVRPDRAILCGDGAEDEYVYPIISSRVPIDSVRKVYVKQAPGVEGTFYIINKTFTDPQKRERFLAPLSWIALIICSVYLIANAIPSADLTDWFLASTTTIIIFMIGLLLLLYSYNMFERGREWSHKWMVRAKAGSLTVIFMLAAVIFILFGFIVGIYSLNEVHTTNISGEIAWFTYNATWLIIFGFMFYLTGDVLDRYLNNRQIKYSSIIYCLDLLAGGLMITAFLDLLLSYLHVYQVDPLIYVAEFAGGIVTSMIGAYLQRRMRRDARKRAAADEVQ